MELLNEETLRKIRLAYTLGSMREIYEQEMPVPSVGCGDAAMFVIPLEIHVDFINKANKKSGNPFKLGTVTQEEITSVLKIVHGEDYDELVAIGAEERRKMLEKERKKE